MDMLSANGKVFGKLSVTTVLILLAFLGGVIVAVRINVGQPTEEVYVLLQLCEKSENSVYVVKNCGNVNPRLTKNLILAGEVANASYANGLAEVLRVYNIEPKNILLETRIRATKTGGVYHLANQQIKVGNPLILSSSKQDVYGTILDFSSDYDRIRSVTDYKYIKRIIVVRNLSVELAVAEKIGVGDKQINEASMIIATVLDKQVKPAKVITYSADGGIFEKDHPSNKNVILRVEILAKEAGGYYYFQDRIIKVGKQLSLNMTDYDVSGTITDVY